MHAPGGSYLSGDVLLPIRADGQHELPRLGYAMHDLEPVIDAETMALHYGKHHQAYVDGFNAALEHAPSLRGLPVSQVLTRLDEAPEEVRAALHNMGGGHFNHSFFWNSLTPEKGAGVPEEVRLAMTDAFGSLYEFMKVFETAGAKQFGSGWVWLCANTSRGNQLEVVSFANQDTPLGTGMVGLLPCDVWEHAYYLNYRNRRADWLKTWWPIVNWQRVAQRLTALRERCGSAIEL